jgi:hypothetical protein
VIGNRSGVANIFGINFSGFLAWWLWRTIYLFKLPRLEKKVRVALDLEKKVRVALDWTLDLCFAKDFACVMSSPKAPLGAFHQKNIPAASIPRGVPSRPISSADRGNGAVTFRWPWGIIECCRSVGAGFLPEGRFKSWRGSDGV